MELYNFVSLGGLFVLMGIAWLLSADKKRMNWRLILWGVGLQLFFGFLVFVLFDRLPDAYNPFLILNNVVNAVIGCSSAGVSFLFGSLASQEKMGFILAFQTLPTIIFFSALMGILYYCGIMPFIIRIFSAVFTRLMRVSGAEAVCTASNIFAGVESALTIRPHLKKMTRSELCVVLTAGMATVSSNILALYVFALNNQFPTIAAHLISASVLAAPAAILMAKIMVPEHDKPETLGISVHPHYDRESNVFEAIINGANAGVKLIVGIATLLVAVLGLVALLNLFLGWMGGHLNTYTGWHFSWTLSSILGLVFYPLTLILGVPPQDATFVAKIIGARLIETEVPSYFALGDALTRHTLAHPRSAVIAVYALCGFAHVASLAIFIGGTAALVPEKTRALTEVGWRALIAATLACLMTGCIAGIFFTGHTLLFK